MTLPPDQAAEIYFTPLEERPTECDECGDSLVDKGYCGYMEEDGSEKDICLVCAQIKALRCEFPFEKEDSNE